MNPYIDKSQMILPDHIDLVGPLGQIGLCLLKRLETLKIRVNAIYRKNRLHENEGDINLSSIQWIKFSEIQKHTPSDYLIFTPNIIGLPDYLEKCYLNYSQNTKRVVCFSSTSIFSKENSGNLAEKNLIKQMRLAEDKIIAICNKRNIKWTIFRPTMIYGMGLDANITRLINFINKWGFFIVTANGRGLRMPVHADDLALATLTVLKLEKTYNKAYNLGGGETLSYYQLLQKIFSHLSKKPRIYNSNYCWPWLLDLSSKLKFLKKNFNGEMARRMERDLLFDFSEATRDFGYAPRKLQLSIHPSIPNIRL